jgi:hypothetical protein
MDGVLNILRRKFIFEIAVAVAVVAVVSIERCSIFKSMQQKLI